MKRIVWINFKFINGFNRTYPNVLAGSVTWSQSDWANLGSIGQKRATDGPRLFHFKWNLEFLCSDLYYDAKTYWVTTFKIVFKKNLQLKVFNPPPHKKPIFSAKNLNLKLRNTSLTVFFMWRFDSWFNCVHPMSAPNFN